MNVVHQHAPGSKRQMCLELLGTLVTFMEVGTQFTYADMDEAIRELKRAGHYPELADWQATARETLDVLVIEGFLTKAKRHEFSRLVVYTRVKYE